MHIIIALLGAVATALWILHRLAEMGISLAGLNPFLWRRRRDWAQRYNADPIYQLESPLEVMALLMVAVAKADGDMSGAERGHLLAVFRDVFQLTDKEAAALLNASAHLYGRGDSVTDRLDAVLAPSRERFNDQQRRDAVPLLEGVASADGPSSDAQRVLIRRVGELLVDRSDGGAWQ